MTTVLIPPLTVCGLVGATGSAMLIVQLVSAAGRPLVGVLATDGGPVTCFAEVAVPPRTGDPDADPPAVEMSLTPQPSIAGPDGGATYYRFSFIADRQQVAEWRVQVPDTDTALNLVDLIGSSAIGSADFAATLMVELRAAAAAADTDRTQTGLDVTATAADRVATGLNAAATAADRVATGLDAAATAADRTQTGLDKTAAAQSASSAAQVVADLAARAGGGIYQFPNVLFGVVGRAAKLYFDGLTAAIDPSIQWNVYASAGGQYRDRWELTPGDANADNTSISVSANTITGALISAKAVNLKVTGAHDLYSPTILFIGDSTADDTAIALSGLLAADANVSPTFVGTGGTAPKHESHSGKTLAWLMTSIDSPFVFSGVFDFAQYLTTNAIAAPSVVILQMGINELFPAYTDAEAENVFALNKPRIDTIAAAITTANPIAWLIVSLVIPPGTQDTFATAYGVGKTEWQHRRVVSIYNQAMVNATWGVNVLLAPTNVAISRDNYENGVHPTQAGYAELAEALCGVVKYTARGIPPQQHVYAYDWANSKYNYAVISSSKTWGEISNNILAALPCSPSLEGVVVLFAAQGKKRYRINLKAYRGDGVAYFGILLFNGTTAVNYDLPTGKDGGFYLAYTANLNYSNSNSVVGNNAWLTSQIDVDLSAAPDFTTIGLHVNGRHLTDCALFIDKPKIDLTNTSIQRLT